MLRIQFRQICNQLRTGGFGQVVKHNVEEKRFVFRWGLERFIEGRNGPEAALEHRRALLGTFSRIEYKTPLRIAENT